MNIKKLKNMVVVESEVPCDQTICRWLHIRGRDFNNLIQHSRQYENAYLAWETVRIIRNPFFEEGTGFEGYFIGIIDSPEQMLDKLIEIGRHILNANYRLYRFDYAFRSRLMKTLHGELNDPKAIDVWAAAFGAMLGRLRCNVYLYPDISRFNSETYRIVNHLPRIQYEQRDTCIAQAYCLQLTKTSCLPKHEVTPELLKPCDYDAGIVAWSVGRFGHPLLREYLRETCTPAHELHE